MNTKPTPQVQPLQPAQTALLSGEIIQLAGNSPGVIDQWRNVHQINTQCQLLPQLQAGDRVVFCKLDTGQVAVLHKLVGVSGAQPDQTQNIEFSLPGIDDLRVTLNDTGIELRAGETLLQLNRDGSLCLNARELKQTALENLRLKGGNVHIN